MTLRHSRTERPWRNLAPPAPLPPPDPQRWQWRPGEMALGPLPKPQRPANPRPAESVRRATNG
jgi:hypothetical protein